MGKENLCEACIQVACMLDRHSTTCGMTAAQFALFLSWSAGGLVRDSASVWLPPNHGTKQKVRFEVGLAVLTASYEL